MAAKQLVTSSEVTPLATMDIVRSSMARRAAATLNAVCSPLPPPAASSLLFASKVVDCGGRRAAAGDDDASATAGEMLLHELLLQPTTAELLLRKHLYVLCRDWTTAARQHAGQLALAMAATLGDCIDVEGVALTCAIVAAAAVKLPVVVHQGAVGLGRSVVEGHARTLCARVSSEQCSFLERRLASVLWH